jgi:hypothetical protein
VHDIVIAQSAINLPLQHNTGTQPGFELPLILFRGAAAGLRERGAVAQQQMQRQQMRSHPVLLNSGPRMCSLFCRLCGKLNRIPNMKFGSVVLEQARMSSLTEAWSPAAAAESPLCPACACPSATSVVHDANA